MSGLLPPNLSYQEKKRFFHEVRSYQWDDPYLYKMCSNHVIRKCVPNEEIPHIVHSCHAATYREHFGGHKTIAKVLQSGYYWPSIFKDAYKFVKCCDRCQKIGNISQKYKMPLTNILEVELFDIWGIDLWVHSHHLNLYIQVVVDYMSK